MKRPLTKVCMTLLCFCMAVAACDSDALAAGGKLEILTSTFPIYQITRNVTKGWDSVNVSLMIPAQLGCPHDYALTPRDMRKLSKADVLIINGLGMEEFLGTPVKEANSKLKIMDSSIGIKDILNFTDVGEHEQARHKTEHEGEHRKEPAHEDRHAHEHEHPDHHHAGANPHLFASPRMVALLAMNIAAGLSGIDPAGARIYSENARAYAEAMNRLADEFAALGKQLANNRIVTQHGVFDYLARDMGLDVVAVVQAHAGQEPSASEMLAVVKTIRQEKAGAIFTEPQYPEKIGRTIAAETGIAAATLDPVATGPEAAPLDYYETRMRQNHAIIGETLGTR
ncbi:MAG: zinc ABC transporter substrate-binding protein [Pseudomonadota bacterium]